MRSVAWETQWWQMRWPQAKGMASGKSRVVVIEARHRVHASCGRSRGWVGHLAMNEQMSWDGGWGLPQRVHGL